MFFRLTYIFSTCTLCIVLGILIARGVAGSFSWDLITIGLMLVAFVQSGFLYFLYRSRDRVIDLSRTPELKDFQQAKTDFESYRRDVQRDLEVEATRIDHMSRKLADRYRVIHEWLDTPEFIDIRDGQIDAPDPLAITGVVGKRNRTQYVQLDREVAKILDKQAEIVYERIRKNYYAPQGQFDTQLFRDDMMTLVTDIAHVYQPTLKNPLLSTSPEQLARALNRIGLHLLVVMDQLPIDLKAYNIQQTYDTVRHAVKVYGNYVKASPYIDWASKGLLFGRVVTSINPVTLGLWWGAAELGKYGAKKIASRIIDQQAIGMLQSLIRVIGYEVAGIYGGDFRHRDANWCYGVEVTQMAATLPASRASIQSAMKEITRLELRNEYDRLALYRAISAGKAISRSHVHTELLTEEERRQILELLEKHFHESAHGQKTADADKWRRAVQEHLGLQFSILAKTGTSRKSKPEQQDREILQAMTAFLINVRQQTPTETRQRLSESGLRDSIPLSLSEEDFQKELQELTSESRLSLLKEFAPPDLDPADPRVNEMLKVLYRWNAQISPLVPEAEELLIELALYYRKDSQKSVELQQEAFRLRLLENFPAEAEAIAKFTGRNCRALAYLNDSSEKPQIPEQIYERITVKWERPWDVKEIGYPTDAELVIYVMPDSILLVDVGQSLDLPEILWKADDRSFIENKSGVMTAMAELTGGQMSPSLTGNAVQSLSLEAPMTARFQSYFAPLLDKLSVD